MFSAVSTVRMGMPTNLRQAQSLFSWLTACSMIAAGIVLTSSQSMSGQWLGGACVLAARDRLLAQPALTTQLLEFIAQKR